MDRLNLMNAPVDEPVVSSPQHSYRALDDTMQDNPAEVSPSGTASSSGGHLAGDEWPAFSGMPRWLRAELRSDHAGEYGAVMIYRGILAISRDAQARQFAERHLVTEARHLKLMEEIVPPANRTRLLPLWHVMGWLTGALPALFGRRIYLPLSRPLRLLSTTITRSKLCAWAMQVRGRGAASGPAGLPGR